MIFPSKFSIQTLALVAGFCAVSARRLPNLHRPYIAAANQVESHVESRTTGTGPKGFLTLDDRAHVEGFHAASVHSASTAAGESFSACLEDTTASVADCQAVIGDIRANNGTIKVAGGFCLNWWEGGCLGRVCGGKSQEVFSEDSQWIANTMTASILNTCVAEGKSGAAADCADVSTTCGTYKLSLQAYTGI
ncbi:hypothetical protein F5Y00DRAFT_246514 [Daldinia vernicosa]|uniref:uncharacterized protein n=1 Tax=Daldinia vernicosa TaxID=114800 RepID=UPI002008C53A|nr:uncharacterized protein F5Y00DRAFT_246514 [Daldinia vernicosa]KAI0845272.1 hypothetical protein F5Y00DRAFT_246514 [Daldinia vernicosa]